MIMDDFGRLSSLSSFLGGLSPLKCSATTSPNVMMILVVDSDVGLRRTGDGGKKRKKSARERDLIVHGEFLLYARIPIVGMKKK